jgi:hypothetical protein
MKIFITGVRSDKMPKVIKLTAENFIEQIVRYGYFAEQIPKCFNSELLVNNLSNVLPHVICNGKVARDSKKNSTSPVTLSAYKNDISRRVLSLPNPAAFLRTVKLMKENWDVIKEASDSPSSLSPITYLHKYCDEDIELLNSENIRETKKSKSDFIEGIKNCVRISLGHKYRLKVDISNCYNSIYTHSVAWAMCGKAEAKKYMRTKEPAMLKGCYELADYLDTFTRYQKNNETNGIVIGPFTSRIFSEIVLAELDRCFMKKGYCFRRYVDDYKFYFRSETQAQESLPQIERILNEYNLNLNQAKTEIKKYPYEIISQMKNTYDNAMKREGIFGVLNAASHFYKKSEKGAYKYALKYIRDKEIPIEDFDIILPGLINIMLLDPRYGKYVISYLKANVKRLDIGEISTIINKELESSLSCELQQESLLFLYLIRELMLTINAKNLLEVLRSSEDFAIIIALDIWMNNNNSVKRSKAEAAEINKNIKELAESLEGEKYEGPRWLLLYEVGTHELLDTTIYSEPKTDIIFTEMKRNKVSFYNSIKK